MLRALFLAVVLCAAHADALAQSRPSLGAADSFAVLGGGRVTNSGPTILAGNVGSRAPVSGLSAANFVVGENRSDAADAALRDVAEVYADLGNLPCGETLPSEIGGRTLGPGVYCVPSAATLTGTLTLDAGGNAGAVWIFKLGSLGTAPASVVDIVNGGRDGNVFWRIAGPATFGAKSYFIGNVLALSDIAAAGDANVAGRLLSQTGTVTLNDSAVTICCDVLTMLPRIVPDATKGTAYTQTLVASGGAPPYTFVLAAGQLPPGITLSANGTLSGVPSAEGTFQAAIVLTDSRGISCIRVYTISVSIPAPTCPTIALSALPDPVACAFYEQRIEPTGGTPPYVFTAPPALLPPGFSLSSAGVLSGTTAAGVHTFPVTATDALGCSASRTYVLRASGELTLLPEALPDGNVDTAYEAKLSVSGGTGPFTFSISDGHPPGLELLADGTLKGTPTRGGCYTFSVTVTNGACTVSRTYGIVICPVDVTFSPATLPGGTACELYPPTPIVVTGCTGPYTLTASLPEGLRFDPPGVISGTPAAPGAHDFTVIATGARGCTATRDYRISVGCATPTVPPELPDGMTCELYEHRIEPAGGCGGPYSFSASPITLPPGLTLSPEGVLSGTPTAPGDYDFEVTITPRGCPPTTVTLRLTVICHIGISPTDLPSATVGVLYQEPLIPCGGTPPYEFTVIAGALPDGFVLDDGEIVGEPTTAGCSTFTIRAEDSTGCSGERTYQLCAVPAAPAAPTLSGWGVVVLCALLAALGAIASRGGNG